MILDLKQIYETLLKTTKFQKNLGDTLTSEVTHSNYQLGESQCSKGVGG